MYYADARTAPSKSYRTYHQCVSEDRLRDQIHPRCFCRPPPPRTLDEIRADIPAVEQETAGLLTEILGR